MTLPPPTTTGTAPAPRRRLTEPRLIRWTLVGLTLAFLSLFLAVPLTADSVSANVSVACATASDMMPSVARFRLSMSSHAWW